MLVSYSHFSTVRLNIKANLSCFQCAFPFPPSSHFLLLIFRNLSQFRSRCTHFLKTSATQASINHFLPSVVRPFVPEPVHGPCVRLCRSDSHFRFLFCRFFRDCLILIIEKNFTKVRVLICATARVRSPSLVAYNYPTLVQQRFYRPIYF